MCWILNRRVTHSSLKVALWQMVLDSNSRIVSSRPKVAQSATLTLVVIHLLNLCNLITYHIKLKLQQFEI